MHVRETVLFICVSVSEVTNYISMLFSRPAFGGLYKQKVSEKDILA